MFRRRLLIAALALASAPVFATTYTLDPNHTQVQFVWNHFGFTNLTGQFGKIEGTLDFDAADPSKSSVTATISIDSVNSNVKKLDGELLGADYFDAAKFPTATFKSTRVEKGATPDQLKVTGDLSVHGVTKPATLDVTVTKVGDHPMRKAPAAGFERDDDDQALGFRHHQVRADGQRRRQDQHRHRSDRSQGIRGRYETAGEIVSFALQSAVRPSLRGANDTAGTGQPFFTPTSFSASSPARLMPTTVALS